MKQKKPLLTISLLISNRPDTIPRCLDSLKLIMDKIPSELILIDTSKSEEIHKMLLTYTDRVYEFEWCRDFAKARNEGVRRARGQWFLYLDDDEWVADADAILKFFQTGKYKKYECANIWVRNFTNPEYTKYSDNWVTRLFYLGKGAKFEGKIHEYIYPIYGEPAFLQAVINHSGYIFTTEEKRREHFERNSSLLLDVIKEEPDTLRWKGQLVQEYRTVKEWKEMAEFCEKSLKNVKKFESFMDRNHFCTLYAGLIEGLMNLERHEDSIAVCEQALKDERSTELLKAFVYLHEAQNYLEINEFDKAKEFVEKYMECHKRFDKNVEDSQRQLGALLVHSTFEPEYMEIAYNILIYAELKKENLDDDSSEDEEKGVKQIDALSGIRFVRFMVKLMATMEYKDVFLRFVNNACLDATMCNWVCAEAQQWEEKDSKAFEKVAYVLAQAESDFWFIRYCKVLTADANKNKAQVEQAVEGLLQSLSNVFYLPDKVYDIVDKYKIRIALLWDKIAAGKWQAQMSHFVNNCEEKYVEKVRVLLQKAFKQGDWHIVSLELVLMERQIMAGPRMQVMEYYDLLKQYAQNKIYFYCNMHKDDGEEIPSEVQAAVKINEYIELEAQNKVQGLGKLKEVVDVCPAFAKGIGQFVHLYAELERQRAEKQKKEMRELRNQVIEQVRGMLAKRQYDAAIQIVGQLKQMFPEDLEVAQLALEVRLKTLE